MTIVLLFIGLVAIAVGFVTIGFGIPTNQLSFGNTLIEVGSISVATGLILIGLAAVLGQLRRINAALQGRALGRGSESVESLVPPAPRSSPDPDPRAGAAAGRCGYGCATAFDPDAGASAGRGSPDARAAAHA